LRKDQFEVATAQRGMILQLRENGDVWMTVGEESRGRGICRGSWRGCPAATRVARAKKNVFELEKGKSPNLKGRREIGQKDSGKKEMKERENKQGGGLWG